MSPKLQPVRGTKDVLFDEARKFRHIIETARKVGELYGFQEMHTPIFEFTEVFKRTLGETSDVVNKEMYTFEDRGGESLTLRPEFTAGIARAFISNGLQQNLPLKLFTSGPLFRYERPQKGRQRQFHQVNFEWLGRADAMADVELILLAQNILQDMGVLHKTILYFNTLGDLESRQLHTEALVKYLKAHQTELSEDSCVRLEKNPLRILDSKAEEDREIIKNAPVIDEFLTRPAAEFFDVVRECLESNNFYARPDLQIVRNPRLVRGLDYYTHTVFEFIDITPEAGAQNTVLAGGRYDGLVHHMGGQTTPAIGFAAGMERLMPLIELAQTKPKCLFIIALGVEEEVWALQTATRLRAHHRIWVEVEFTDKIGKAMEAANKLGASYALIMGANERSEGYATLQNLVDRSREKIPLHVLEEEIVRRLR